MSDTQKKKNQRTVVRNFVFDHVSSKDVLVLGMSPAPINRKPFVNCSLRRLDRWMKEADQPQWSFHNVIPNIPGSCAMRDVDVRALLKAVNGKKIVISLGSFVESVCKKHGIENFRIDHPSPRNRKFNDPSHEPKMVEGLRKFLKSKK